MKEAAHLLRLGGVLLAGTIVFVALRAEFVPEGFGTYGHYRAGALLDARTRPLAYAGRSACTSCHDDVVQTLKASTHASIGCEACHGPLASHAEDASAKITLPDPAKLCARCHESNSARPQNFPQVVLNEHMGGDACNSCHLPHSPKMGG